MQLEGKRLLVEVVIWSAGSVGQGEVRLGRGFLRGQGVGQWLFYWNGGDAAECKDRSRRWTVYNPLFTNSYVDVGMF